jgi:hypothetical protein
MNNINNYFRQSKRANRRNRWRKKLELRTLDELALKSIRKSYMFSACTWGGTRCPDCGVAVRPHWLADYSGRIVNTETGQVTGHFSGFGIDCSKVGNCKNREYDWETKACAKY